jgi:3-dehydroquinate synthase II
MVPLENLVAASRGTSTRIAAAIDEEVELNGAAFAMGGGVDAILVPIQMVDDAIRVLGGSWEKEELPEMGVTIVEARVLSIDGAGVGERVCVDLTRRINDGQGIATGSLSGNLCLLHGETIQSEYVPTRPFRVNAGAVHSYVLMADGKTKYLSELISGDEVAVLSSSGEQEKATIGRLKVETRPLLIIRFEVSGSEGQIVVQQAETVRLITPNGGVISVTQVKEGDKISVITDNRARHVGFPLNAGVSEK